MLLPLVPVTQNVLQLVETFKKSGKHLALVADGTLYLTYSDAMGPNGIANGALVQDVDGDNAIYRYLGASTDTQVDLRNAFRRNGVTLIELRHACAC